MLRTSVEGSRSSQWASLSSEPEQVVASHICFSAPRKRLTALSFCGYDTEGGEGGANGGGGGSTGFNGSQWIHLRYRTKVPYSTEQYRTEASREMVHDGFLRRLSAALLVRIACRHELRPHFCWALCEDEAGDCGSIVLSLDALCLPSLGAHRRLGSLSFAVNSQW